MPELVGLLLRLGVEVPADLEVVGDEADRADQHVVDAPRVERLEVVEDVGPEPRLAGRRLGLEAEGPVAQRRTPARWHGGLQELILVRVALCRGCAPAGSAR